jgi:hypothetical protein
MRTVHDNTGSDLPYGCIFRKRDHMKKPILFSFVLAVFSPQASMACSCFGPPTFCGTLFPIGPNPEWWEPDAVILAVKLSDYQHGMDVKVVQSFDGVLAVDDTVRVWGDCGLLCRHYPSTWAVGDTVVWALRITDLAGNSMCGTNYEQAGDYMISVCGTYWLEYDQGMVTGPITTETVQSMTLVEFIQTIEGCGSTGWGEQLSEDDLTIQYEGTTLVIAMSAAGQPMDVLLYNARGQVVLARNWNGEPWRLQGQVPGAYLLQVRSEDHNWSRKVAVLE